MCRSGVACDAHVRSVLSVPEDARPAPSPAARGPQDERGKPLLNAVLDVALLTTKHFFPAGGKINLVRAQIPIPQPIVRPPHGQRVPLFAVAQSLFGLLA